MPSNNPRVTVLMPVYNGEKYLREAVNSVLNQDYEDYELLVIDDGSTDNTQAVMAEYSDPRIRVLPNERNLGLVKTLNRGITEARGEYIARLDADDISLPTRLSKQVDYLDNNQSVHLLATLFETIDADGSVVWSPGHWQPSPEDVHYKLIFQNIIGHSTVMFRKHTVASLGTYEEGLIGVEDWDLWSRVSRMSRVEILPEILCKWRDTDIGLQRRFKKEQHDFETRIFIKNVESRSGSVHAQDMLCFHANLFGNKEHMLVSAGAVMALSEFHRGLVSRCPAYLQKNQLQRCCDQSLVDSVREAIRNGSTSERLTLLRTPHLWKSITCVAILAGLKLPGKLAGRKNRSDA